MNGSSKPFLRLGVLVAGLFALLAGCDGDGGATEPDPCRVRELTVIPRDTTVAQGAVFSLLVHPVSDCDVSLSFSVSSDVVTIDPAIQLVTAKKQGQANVTVRARDTTVTARVTVVAP